MIGFIQFILILIANFIMNSAGLNIFTWQWWAIIVCFTLWGILFGLNV